MSVQLLHPLKRFNLKIFFLNNTGSTKIIAIVLHNICININFH
jgi:hypothetical protein